MLDASSWACTYCGEHEKTLHVHHKQYFKGRMAWEYGDDELIVLCEDCHKEEHNLDEIIKRILSQTDSRQVLALLSGAFGDALNFTQEEFAFCSRQSEGVFLAGLVASDFSDLPDEEKIKVLDITEAKQKEKK